EVAFAHLVSVKGIAAASALAILAELAVLPQDMSAREWVAHAGLDPRRHESGTSVKGPVRISKVGNNGPALSCRPPVSVPRNDRWPRPSPSESLIEFRPRPAAGGPRGPRGPAAAGRYRDDGSEDRLRRRAEASGGGAARGRDSGRRHPSRVARS